MPVAYLSMAHLMADEPFSVFAERRWGPQWIIGSNTRKNRERFHGLHIVRQSQYNAVHAEWQAYVAHGKKSAAEIEQSLGWRK